MSLKRAILNAVTESRLSSIAEALEVPTSAGDIKLRLQKSPRIDARDVLPMLDDKEVVAACTAYRVHAAGKRQDIIGRLLEVEAYRDSGSEVALYDLGPFAAVAVDVRPKRGGVRVLYCTVAQRAAGLPLAFTLNREEVAEGKGKGRLTRLARACNDVGFVAALGAPRVKTRLQSLFHAAGLNLPAREFQCTSALSRRVFGEGAEVLDERACEMSADERLKKAALAVLRARDAVRVRHLGHR